MISIGLQRNWNDWRVGYVSGNNMLILIYQFFSIFVAYRWKKFWLRFIKLFW